MSKTYRPYEPDQMYLMPPSLQEWLPDDHMVFFLRDVLATIAADAPAPRGRIPKHLSAQQRMERKLFTKKGKRIYAKRKSTVEPVIGQINHAQGFRQFSLRGLLKAEAEWCLVAATHNLRKLFAACKAQPSRRLLFAG